MLSKGQEIRNSGKSDFQLEVTAWEFKKKKYAIVHRSVGTSKTFQSFHLSSILQNVSWEIFGFITIISVFTIFERNIFE